MKNIKDFKDATEPLWFVIKPRHALHCKRRDAENCVNARAILSIPGVWRVHVFKGITYIHFEKDEVPTRYQNSSDATYFACLNDSGGRKKIIDEIRSEAVKGSCRVQLLVPRATISKGNLRSALMKERRQVARQRRKHKDTARPYKAPHKEGMRSGQGLAHTWE